MRQAVPTRRRTGYRLHSLPVSRTQLSMWKFVLRVALLVDLCRSLRFLEAVLWAIALDTSLLHAVAFHRLGGLLCFCGALFLWRQFPMYGLVSCEQLGGMH